MVGMLNVKYTSAQVTTQDVTMTVVLNSTLNLSMVSGNAITFTFSTATDYNNGIATGPTYTTNLTVDANVDWDLNVRCLSASLSSGGGDLFDLDNIGLKVANNGGTNAPGVDYVLDGGAANFATVAALTNVDQLLITPAATPATNKGNAAANNFNVEWECGTTPGGASGMNAQSMMDQNLVPTTYSGTVTFTLSQN